MSEVILKELLIEAIKELVVKPTPKFLGGILRKFLQERLTLANFPILVDCIFGAFGDNLPPYTPEDLMKGLEEIGISIRFIEPNKDLSANIYEKIAKIWEPDFLVRAERKFSVWLTAGKVVEYEDFYTPTFSEIINFLESDSKELESFDIPSEAHEVLYLEYMFLPASRRALLETHELVERLQGLFLKRGVHIKPLVKVHLYKEAPRRFIKKISEVNVTIYNLKNYTLLIFYSPHDLKYLIELI
jgi:hypothetical protein